MENVKLEWRTEKRKISDLIPYDKNPRQMTKKQAEDLQASLEKFNLMSIPVINTDNLLISGHQRVNILKRLGRESEEIDVRVPNRQLTEAEIKEANIRENKNLGEFDWDLIADHYEAEDLIAWGFDQKELEKNLGIDFSKPEENEVPAIKEICPACGQKILRHAKA